MTDDTNAPPTLAQIGAVRKELDSVVRPPAPAPTPRKIQLPLGGDAEMFTRENLTVLFKCSHGELGRLLARRMAPLPVRIDGQILWYIDEVKSATPQVLRTLARWKQRR